MHRHLLGPGKGLYLNCCIDPTKFGKQVFTREWALAVIETLWYLIIFVVAEEIAEVPFTPGHEMVGQVSQLRRQDIEYLWIFLALSTQIFALGPSVPPEYSVGKRICVENHFYCGHCYQCTHGTVTIEYYTNLGCAPYLSRSEAYLSESEPVWLW